MITFEQNQELLRQASFSRTISDWHPVVEAVTRQDSYSESAAQDDMSGDEKESHLANLVEQVQTHAGQLAVVYEFADSRYHRIHSMVIDKESPLKLTLRSDVSENDARSKQYRYGVAINYANRERSPGTSEMPGAREIAFSNEKDDTNPVWMGGGVREEHRDLSGLYPKEPNIIKYDVAIGTDRVGELFTFLRRQDGIPGQRLFGALFHVALLGEDFGTELPLVPDFHEQVEIARDAIMANKSVSHVVRKNDLDVSQYLKATMRIMNDGRDQIRLSAERAETVERPYLPYVGDERSWPYLDVKDPAMELRALESVSLAVAQEQKEHGRRIIMYAKWINVLNRLVP